jgi:hypothetical protein
MNGNAAKVAAENLIEWNERVQYAQNNLGQAIHSLAEIARDPDHTSRWLLDGGSLVRHCADRLAGAIVEQGEAQIAYENSKEN